jgi:hypothetical protein
MLLRGILRAKEALQDERAFGASMNKHYQQAILKS